MKLLQPITIFLRKTRGAFALLAAAFLLLGANQALGRSAPVAPEQGSPIHPDIPLLDAQGENVLLTGQPVSTMRTCGACHDTSFISRHSFHAHVGLTAYDPQGAATAGHAWDTSNGYFGNWNALTYRYLSPPGDERPDLTTPDWVRLFGARHAGGGPAETSRDGAPLTDLIPSARNPETAVLNEGNGRFGAWNWDTSGTIELNCFLCHLAAPDNNARLVALETGDFGWANTATLAATGLVQSSDSGYTWNPAAFDENGLAAASTLQIQDPANANCGLCHGLVHDDIATPVTLNNLTESDWRTLTTGQILSGQRLSNSGLNLKDKANLTRSWDIHIERGLQCVDCHYALNNPVFTQRDPANLPDHLLFDPRRLDLGDYLYQPLHQFARGQSAQSAVAPELWNTMRRCESCHDASAAHTWLPYVERHTTALACETCHAPQIYAPAIQSRDWTVLTATGESLTEHRGVDGALADPASLVEGYAPVILQRTTVDGTSALAPYNLVTSWYWVYDEPARPVRQIDLEAVWLTNGRHAPELLRVFDADQDGLLNDLELRLDTPEKAALIQTRLVALGLKNPRIAAEVQPYSINHNIARGEWATSECRDCHGAESTLAAEITLAGYIPGGVLPEFIPETHTRTSGNLVTTPEGQLRYQPAPAEDGLYVLGHHSVTWVDWFGILAFLGTFFGVTVHGGLRWLALRRQPPSEPQLKRVYMYSVYERFWHWLQTFTILILLFTGLIIHKPEMFGLFSFSGVVIVHNVLAALLVLNAALSLFYHLVSGEIQQYIPRPYGFFDQAVLQAKFYLRGIFRNEPHPFDKTPQAKLNPLQKMVYFGILNVLLPLQILTGALMWGAQRWPDLAERFGGLPFLGPAHTLIAWLFATFIVAHIYLTTTSHEPLASIKAMMLGWDEVETHSEERNTP